MIDYDERLARQDYLSSLAAVLAKQVCTDCDIDLWAEQCWDLAKQNAETPMEAEYLESLIRELAWEDM